MKEIKFVIILVFFTYSSSCIEVNSKNNLVLYEGCRIEFTDLNIKDFLLGTPRKSIIEKFPSIKRINKNINSVENYMFRQNSVILGDLRNVEYNFSFKNDSLISYLFEFEGNLELFKKMIEKSKKIEANNFIKNNSGKTKYNYFLRNNTCFKFFNLKKYDSKIIISGGVRNRMK